MNAHVVPAALVVRGTPPQWTEKNDPQCRTCGDPYSRHSGSVCAVCRHPVEHHTDIDAMNLEIEGYARVSAARDAAGLELNAAAEWCLGEVF